jgi:tRNA threonylcarbamoyladenosine biosynthesis protein TsaB
LAEAKFKINDIENVAYFEPYYLKEFMLGWFFYYKSESK